MEELSKEELELRTEKVQADHKFTVNEEPVIESDLSK